MKFSLPQINQLPRAEFVAALSDIVEHSPWVVEKLWDHHRPFASLHDMHRAIVNIMRDAGPEVWLKTLRLHPELSGKEADAGTLTDFSSAEQSGLGLHQLPKDDYLKIRDFNQRYHQKFGFPFVVCVRQLRNRAALYAVQESRFHHSKEEELAMGIEQVYEIARLRLETLISESQPDEISA